jgi:hypothetical protein
LTGKTQEFSMRIIDAPLAVLRFHYRIVRFPLQLIEDRVARMGTEVPARLFYERSLGLLDVAVGNALGDSQLERRGGALVQRSDALRRAAQLDAAANQVRQQSRTDLKAKSDKAIEDQQNARAAKERDVEEARTSAKDRKRAAEEGAAQRAATANKRVDGVAAHRRSSATAAKRTEQARIRANEQKATAAANSKLDEAQARRNKATTKRAQADRVETLAGAEKRKRKAARANKN